MGLSGHENLNAFTWLYKVCMENYSEVIYVASLVGNTTAYEKKPNSEGL